MPSLKPNNNFVLNSANEVPESYAWSSTAADDDYPITTVPFPVVDLSGTDAAHELAQAFRSCGAVQITGHGVPEDLLARFEAQLVRLFSLPTERKLAAAMPEGGGEGYGGIPIEKFFNKQMWTEGLTFSGVPVEHARKLWPEDPKPFCDTMEEYDKAMKALGLRVIYIMLGALGVDDYDDIECIKEGAMESVVRINSYPACPDPDRAMGMAAHFDTSLVTVLYQNGPSGLQVLRNEDQNGPSGWATVPSRPGSLIVILGDLFQILTNGQFRSCFHRVVVNRNEQRLSSAHFSQMASNVKVSPAVKLLKPEEGPRYRAVTFAELCEIKYQKKYLNNALEFLKL